MDIDSKSVKLQIWDTAGQDRFKNITASYYRGGHGILVVYDITDQESFKNLNSWLIEIEKNANKYVYKILIGNKNDLEDKRQVTYAQGKDFADTYGMKFIETSAKTNTNVSDAFQIMARDVIEVASKRNDIVNVKKTKVDLKPTGNELPKSKQACC